MLLFRSRLPSLALRRQTRSLVSSASSQGPSQLQAHADRRADIAPGLPIHLGGSVQDRARRRIREVDATNKDAVTASSAHLRDRFHRQHTYLRISLTERCNLRCLYCMPEDGIPLTPKDDLLSTQEVQRIARLFVDEGVNKIRLTGGEPTVRRDLQEIVSSFNDLRAKGLQQIGITSNGISLARKLDGLVASGLTHLNVSLDTLDPFKFEFMTRRRGFEAVMKSIDRALELGIQSLKLNVVVIKGLNDGQDVLDFVEFTRDKPITVRFIEYMPFDGNKWQVGKLVPYKNLVDTIRTRYPDFARLQSKDDANDTSKHWNVPGYRGSVGFITSMTDHFCGTCNRLRITADGNLKVCLFGNAEVSLRDAMRHGYASPSPLLPGSDLPATDEQLLHIIGCLPLGVPNSRRTGRHSHGTSVATKSPAALLMPSPRRTGTAFSAAAGSVTHRDFSSTSTVLERRRAFAEKHNDEGSDGESPWSDLDSAFDRLSEQKHARSAKRQVKAAPSSAQDSGQLDFEEAIFAQAGAAAVGGGLSSTSQMASMIPGNQMGGTPGGYVHQSWSEYMGGGEEGDDSPWASLDAFADHGFNSSAVAMPSSRVPAARPYSPAQSTPRFHSTLQDAPLTSVRAHTDGPALVHNAVAHTVSQNAFDDDGSGARLTHIEAGSGRAAMVDVGHKTNTRRSATASGRVYLPAHALDLVRQAEHGDGDQDGRSSSHALTKGPVLHTAQLAGIMAAKKTADLIPLCHSLALSHVDVRLTLIDAPPQSVSSRRASDFIHSDSARTSSQQGVTGFTPEQLDDPDSWTSASSLFDPTLSTSGGATSGMGYIEIRCTASTSGQTGVEMEALTGCTVACLTIWDMVKAVAGKEMQIGEIKVVEKRGGKSGDWKRSD